MQMAKWVGDGVKFLNRHLSSSMFQGTNGAVNEGKIELFEFLRDMRHQSTKLMINATKLVTLQQLLTSLLRADRYLDELDDEVRGWGGLQGERGLLG